MNDARPVDGFRISQIDEMQAINGGTTRLAGAELGIESFGMQVFDFPAGHSDYPEHDHSSDGQEEVYVVLSGSADFEIDGERVALDVGKMMWVGAGTRRRLEPGPDGVRIMVIGSTPGKPYERPKGLQLPPRS